MFKAIVAQWKKWKTPQNCGLLKASMLRDEELSEEEMAEYREILKRAQAFFAPAIKAHMQEIGAEGPDEQGRYFKDGIQRVYCPGGYGTGKKRIVFPDDSDLDDREPNGPLDHSKSKLH